MSVLLAKREVCCLFSGDTVQRGQTPTQPKMPLVIETLISPLQILSWKVAIGTSGGQTLHYSFMHLLSESRIWFYSLDIWTNCNTFLSSHKLQRLPSHLQDSVVPYSLHLPFCHIPNIAAVQLSLPPFPPSCEEKWQHLRPLDRTWVPLGKHVPAATQGFGNWSKSEGFCRCTLTVVLWPVHLTPRV